MFALNSCESLLLLLLLPKITSITNRKTHLRRHHHHHHHYVKLHFPPPLKAHLKSTVPSPLSSSSPDSPPPDSSSLFADDSPPPSDSSSLFAADFLMDSCGLSSVQALHAIQRVPTLLNDGGRKPRSVIAYFESIGFSRTHISKVALRFPVVLVSYVEKTLKPKIAVFHDYGYSESDVAHLISSNPQILASGLETRIKPALDLIKSIVKTDENLIKTIKRTAILLLSTTWRRNSIEPNMDVLRQHGVPDSEIVRLIVSWPYILMKKPEEFKTIVKRVASFGFTPQSRKFTAAVAAMCKMRKSTWDSKIDLLKGLGWSEVQILDSFRRCPIVLTLSPKNLTETIEFYAESMNWDASVVSRCPVILTISLKIKLIPRYAVLKCLMSNEIIKKDKLCVYMVSMSDEMFLSNYIFKYQDQIPYLYEVYKKKCMLGCEQDNGEITNQQDNGDIDITV